MKVMKVKFKALNGKAIERDLPVNNLRMTASSLLVETSGLSHFYSRVRISVNGRIADQKMMDSGPPGNAEVVIEEVEEHFHD